MIYMLSIAKHLHYISQVNNRKIIRNNIPFYNRVGKGRETRIVCLTPASKIDKYQKYNMFTQFYSHAKFNLTQLVAE